LEFPEVFYTVKSENEKGFDVIFGNPPYVRLHKIPKIDIKYYRSGFRAAERFFDLFCLMIERGLRLTKGKGVFSFIVPSLLLKGFQYKNLRKLILESTEKHSIKIYGDGVFPDVLMPTCVFTFIKGERDKKEITPPFNLIEEQTNYLNRIKTVPLEEITESIQGLEVGRKLLRDSIDGKDYEYVISGDEITRYGIEEVKKMASKDIKAFAKELRFFRAPRMLIRETGGKLTATCFERKLYSLRTIFSFLSSKESPYNLKYLLAIINSKICQKFYEIKFKAETKIFPKIRLAQTRQLPIPYIDFSNPLEKSKHDELAKHVEIMLEKNKQRSELAKIFMQTLKNHSFELQPLGKAYYNNPEYIEKMEKKASDIASSKEEINTISIIEENNFLIFYVFLGDKREDALRLKIEDENLRLFLFYSLRRYLEENKRRRKWSTKSFPKVLDVILGGLEVPIFKTKANLYNVEHNLKMIDLVMKEFKVKFHKKFAKGNIHLSQIEQEI
jgi:hypothetical protein